MPSDNNFDLDDLYQQGVQHFTRGEWQAAVATFRALEATDEHYPGVKEMLADARLKTYLREIEPPVAKGPPRKPVLLRLAMMALLALAVGGSYEAYLLFRSTPPPMAAVAIALPTRVQPTVTATPRPTILPTATATATAEPTPTAASIVSATLVITPADGASFVNTPKNIEIIVDASGSMLAKVDGTDKERWQIAQDALMSMISSGAVSNQSYVALRTYGRRKGGDCGDLELAQHLKRFRGDALAGVVMGIKPAVGGMTPLAASLRAASDDLQAAEGNTAVILVTDGLESCNGDPIAAAASFVKSAPQRTVHVIGFAIDSPEASDKLRQIAASGNGLYFDATNTAQLAEALHQTIVLTYQILTPGGGQVVAGTVGQDGPIRLGPGTYKLRINASPPVEKDLVLDSGSSILVNVRQGYGGLVAEVKDGSQ